MAWVLKRVAGDVIEELDEIDPNALSAYFHYMGTVISWIGTGDDDSLPDTIKEFLQARAGTGELESLDGSHSELSAANTGTG